MRFMIGLLVGAALVLTLAPLLELRPTQIVEGMRAQWTLSESVPGPSGSVTEVAPDPLPVLPLATEALPVSPLPPEPDARPALAVAADDDVHSPGDPPEAESANAAGEGDSGWQSVWTPFYSQMSAEGFARRLADTTERAFAVRKEAPGRYQVVFAYADEQERARVLAAFSAATGVEGP